MTPPILVTGYGTHYVKCIEIEREFGTLLIAIYGACGHRVDGDWMRIDYFGTFMVVNCEACRAEVEAG